MTETNTLMSSMAATSIAGPFNDPATPESVKFPELYQRDGHSGILSMSDTQANLRGIFPAIRD